MVSNSSGCLCRFELQNDRHSRVRGTLRNTRGFQRWFDQQLTSSVSPDYTRRHLEDYRDFRNELEDQEKHFRHEAETLAKQIVKKDQKISELNNTKAQLSAAKESLEAQIKETANTLESLKDINTDFEKEKTTLQGNLAGIQDELANAKALKIRARCGNVTPSLRR